MATLDYDKIVNGIRKALYGYEVREYLAQSMEWTKAFVTQSVAQIKEYLRQAEAARDAAKASQDAAKVSETNAANSATASANSAAESKVSAASSANFATASANSAAESKSSAESSASSAAASKVSAADSANAAMKALKEAADSGAFKGDKGDKGDKGTDGTNGTTNASEINAGILGISYGGTGASTLDQACGNLLWRDTIPENCNWDTLATGIWHTVPERWGTNGPTSVYTYGAVFVWNYAGNVTQIYISHSSTDPICFRQRWTSNNNFSDWRTTASALFATKASGVTDYNDSSRTIQVGWAGDGLNTSNLTHIAGYADNGTKIKDVSKAVLQSWLGVTPITSQTSDPGAGSSLATGSILLVYA